MTRRGIISFSAEHGHRSLFVVVVGAAVFLGLMLFGLRKVWVVYTELQRDCYCLDAVAMMLQRTLISREGQWPNNWSDIFEHYNQVDKITGHAWSKSEIRSRVWVNFDYELSQPAECAFGLNSGRSVHWGEANPVTRVVRRLASRKNITRKNKQPTPERAEERD